MSVLLAGSVVTGAAAYSEAVADPGLTKAYLGVWVTHRDQCNGDPMEINAPFLSIGHKSLETPGMDCQIDRFLYSTKGDGKDIFTTGFIDATCTIEETPGEAMRFNLEWIKPGKTLRVGEEQPGNGNHWYSQPLTKCPK
ncbi:hypothetical protein [Kaistia sp. 32K]|uniref:hypothetical protein n=1 Tax=Kaistia sp. 32K TaxID=2795690 RepID=UPI001915B5C1|nr:hypothetical protein [Kaistia sp. 32K]